MFGYLGRTGSSYTEHIYVVDAAGNQVAKWVPEGAPENESLANDFVPHVNPVTSEIVYSTLRHGFGEHRSLQIATAEFDGSHYRRLTESESMDLSPAWSPDGTRIAFISNRQWYAGGIRDLALYIMDADGSNVRLASRDVTVSSHRPLWSPDGIHIAFRNGHFLYTVNPTPETGSIFVKLLGLTRTDPAWSPDGQWIAFSHSRLRKNGVSWRCEGCWRDRTVAEQRVVEWCDGLWRAPASGPVTVRSGLPALGYAACAACGAGVSAVISLAIRTRL